MPDSKPEYLVYVCANCHNIRHFKPKGDDNIYYCPVCKSEIEYIDGRIEGKGGEFSDSHDARKVIRKVYNKPN